MKKLNPQVKDPNRIYPNDVITLSEEEAVVAEEPVPQEDATPLAEETPPVVESEEKNNSSDFAGRNASDRHRLRVLGAMADTSIEAQAKNGNFKTNLDSNVNTDVEIQYGYYLTDQTVIGFTAGLVQSEFPYTKDGRFKGIAENLKNFSVDLEHNFSDRFRMNGLLGVQQFYFVTENTPTTLTLEPVFIDNVGLALAYDVWRAGGFALGLDAHGTYASPAKGSNFKVKSGYTYGGMIYGGYRLTEMFSLIGNFFYDRRVQDTTGTRQRNNDKGGKFGMQLDF